MPRRFLCVQSIMYLSVILFSFLNCCMDFMHFHHMFVMMFPDYFNQLYHCQGWDASSHQVGPDECPSVNIYPVMQPVTHAARAARIRFAYAILPEISGACLLLPCLLSSVLASLNDQHAWLLLFLSGLLL